MTVSKLTLRLAIYTVAGSALVYALTGFPIGGNAVVWGNDNEVYSDTTIVERNQSKSIFDQLFSSSGVDGSHYDVPFPFSNLVSKIEQHLGSSINDDPNTIKLALFPLSRCVNRFAADPDFFKSPRVVLAVDSEEMSIGSRETRFLKDQLFIGYQQQARSLEIISYNNEEGKFEFQVVSDYSETGQPKVRDARREDCVSCHQNQGPIFPRPYWNETDHNPKIFTAIVEAQNYSDQKIPLVPRQQVTAVSGAVYRANTFSLHQTLWQKGCQSDEPLDGILCRAAILETVILDQLAEGYRGQIPSEQVSRYLIDTLKSNIARFWPQGIELSSSGVPGENPLSTEALEYLEAAEKLQEPRAETAHWRPNDLYRVIKGLGGLVAKSDILKIDQTLNRISNLRQTSTESREGTCHMGVTRSPTAPKYDNQFNGDIAVECNWKDGLSGELFLLGDLYVNQDNIRRHSGLNSVVLSGRDFLVEFAHQGGEIVSANERSRIQLTLSDPDGKLRARLRDGRTIESLNLNWEGHLIDTSSSGETNTAMGKAILKIKSNPRILEEAISKLVHASDLKDLNVFSNKPFNAQAIMPALLNTLEAMEIGALAAPSNSSTALLVK